MNINEELILMGVPAEMFGWEESIGSYALKSKFIKWCGHKNPSKFEKDNLLDGDVRDDVTVVTSYGRTSKKTVKASVLTKRGIRRALFKAKNPVAVEYTDKILDILDEYDRGAAFNETVLLSNREALQWAKARIESIEARNEFTEVIEEIFYKSENKGTSLNNWYSNFTKMMTKKTLGLTEAEFKERKSVTGNFRDSATPQELRTLEAAEMVVVSRYQKHGIQGIKDLYKDAKNSMEVFN